LVFVETKVWREDSDEDSAADPNYEEIDPDETPSESQTDSDGEPDPESRPLDEIAADREKLRHALRGEWICSLVIINLTADVSLRDVEHLRTELAKLDVEHDQKKQELGELHWLCSA
jgi:hypothetical protein